MSEVFNIKKKYLFGIGLVVFAIFITIIAVYIEKKSEIEIKLMECEEKIRDTILKNKKENFGPTQFDDRLTKKQSQPLVYSRNIKIGPGNCKPYSGCFYPSKASNPINLNTGKRDPQPVIDGKDVWCELSWRDCNAYQSCQNGRCVPKETNYGI